MKLWHAICLLFVVLIGTESLVGRKGDTSALDRAQAEIASRAEAAHQAGPATEAEAPAQAASLTAWFAVEEEGADAIGQTDDGVSDESESAPVNAATAAPPTAVLAPRSSFSPQLTLAGYRVASPRTELIEHAM